MDLVAERRARRVVWTHAKKKDRLDRQKILPMQPAATRPCRPDITDLAVMSWQSGLKLLLALAPGFTKDELAKNGRRGDVGAH